MERKQIKTLCKRDGMNAVYFGMDIAQINPQVVYKAVNYLCDKTESLSRQICALFHQAITNIHLLADKLKYALVDSPLSGQTGVNRFKEVRMFWCPPEQFELKQSDVLKGCGSSLILTFKPMYV